MHRKVQNVAKITSLENDYTLITLLFIFLQIILSFSYERYTRSSNCCKIFEKCMKPREQIQMTYFQLISSELIAEHEFKIYFLTKAYFITSDTPIRKIRLIAVGTAEIFKIKNCSIVNLFNLFAVLIH